MAAYFRIGNKLVKLVIFFAIVLNGIYFCFSAKLNPN